MSSTVHTISPLRGCRVLLAEDIELNRFLVKEMLKRQELLLEIVPDGAEAVKATRLAIYDIILMDIHMPEMDGIEATRAIRADATNPNHKVPVIALSASMFANEKDGFLEAGMNAVLEKPFTAEQLVKLMQSFYSPGNKNATVSSEKQLTTDVQQPAIDMHYLLQIGKNSREFAGMMLRSFRDSAVELLADLEKAHTEENRLLAAQVLHKLKFAVSVMGAGNLDAELKWIESEARNLVPGNEKEYTTRLGAFTNTIRTLYKDAIRLIQSGEWG